MNRALHYLEIAELAPLIRAREVSCCEIVQAQLARVAHLDRELHSFALVTAEAALDEALRVDAQIARGHYLGPLHGIPLAVKDLFWTRGQPTAAGTKVYREFRPPCDATTVQRLRAAGAVVLGKLQLTEGAYSDHHPSVTPPANPWDADYWPGISSSGSAVATAAGLCFGSLVSDTGGSIRWPAAACGLTGLKPTWGRVSRHGVFELAPSLDHVGTLARSAFDAGILLSAVAGADPLDPTALHAPLPDLTNFPAGLAGVRIGVDAAWNEEDVDAVVCEATTAATTALRSLGATIVDVEVPESAPVVADWVPNCAVEAAVAHDATYRAHAQEYGPVLSAVIASGRALSGVEYQRILLRRAEFRGRIDAVFDSVDLLLTPVQPFAPLTWAAVRTLGEQPRLIARLQRYTCPFNMTGSPTITLPCGHSRDGLPIGLQLVARHLREDLLIRAGVAYQSVTQSHRRHPVQ